MKQRILTLSLVFLFAVATVFTGCKKDDATTPVIPPPTVSLKNDAGYTATSSTISTGTVFKFGFVAVPASGSKIVAYKVTQSYDGGSANVYMKADSSNLSLTSLAKVYYGNTRNVAGTEKYTVTVTDKNGETATSSFTLTVKVIPATVSQTGTLGAVSNTNGSFFDATNGLVYTETAAGGKSNLVDFAYFSSSATSAGIGAVSDAAVASAYPNSSKWTTKNATKLVKSTSIKAADWASVTDAQIAALATPTATAVNGIAQGDILEFQTAGNKKGLIKIESITPGTTGTVNISVKVQK